MGLTRGAAAVFPCAKQSDAEATRRISIHFMRAVMLPSLGRRKLAMLDSCIETRLEPAVGFEPTSC